MEKIIHKAAEGLPWWSSKEFTLQCRGHRIGSLVEELRSYLL